MALDSPGSSGHTPFSVDYRNLQITVVVDEESGARDLRKKGTCRSPPVLSLPLFTAQAVEIREDREDKAVEAARGSHDPSGQSGHQNSSSSDHVEASLEARPESENSAEAESRDRQRLGSYVLGEQPGSMSQSGLVLRRRRSGPLPKGAPGVVSVRLAARRGS